MQTHASLTSALNMDYLNTLLNFSPWEKYHQNVRKKYIDNTVFQYVKKCNYKTTVFCSVYGFTDLLSAHADTYITPGWQLNDFEEELWTITPLDAFGQFPPMKFRQQYQLTLFTLGRLGHLPPTNHPRFILAHIMCPHTPFIFGPDGRREEIYDLSYWKKTLTNANGLTEEYKKHFTDQTVFLNNKIMGVLTDLLERGDNKPIIVLISDHGNRWVATLDGWPYETARDLDLPFLNLCTIYFPDGDYRQLYPTMSLVNTFRVVLNKYMKTNLPLLEDHSYIYTGGRPDRFVLIDQLRK